VAEADVLEAYCAWADGSGLPDAEAEAGDALATLLRRGGPAARREVVEYALLEAALHRVYFAAPPPLSWWRRPLGPRGWAAAIVLVIGAIGGVIAWQSGRDGRVITEEELPRVVASVGSGNLRVGGKTSSDVLSSTDLEVPAGAPATIRLRDGSTILLRPGSKLRMRRLDDVDRGFEFLFRSGGGDFRLVPGHRELRVVTPFGSVQATGPNFTVSVDDTHRTIQYEGPLRLYAAPPPAPPPAPAPAR
jgi:hypothetical protein